ncbi:MAG TPA: hypothetical protein P5228_05705 [Bacteroidales bacterium]|nr:hypothetical protein [Bacteroidales bacterium]HRZ49237.1 hypothetical protein [Bacteroidales bacterium]
MYDTVNFWLRWDEVAGNQPAILNRLEQITELRDENGQRYTGYMDNYKVSVSDAGISFKGSLAKYYLTDNLHTLTRADAARAIEKLSDEVHLPINRAKITRVDLAANMLTDQPPESYYLFLGDCMYYQRQQLAHSLYYNNGLRTMIFYNKLAEAVAKDVTIPEVLIGQNLLRYELRFLNRLNKQLNNDVTGGQIIMEPFYIDLVNRWYTEYQQIHKIREINLNYRAMKTPGDFWKQGNQQWIKLIGIEAALQMVDQLKALQAFDNPEYYSRLRNQIRKQFCQPDTTKELPFVVELDKKIKQALRYYR